MFKKEIEQVKNQSSRVKIIIFFPKIAFQISKFIFRKKYV